MPVDPRTGQRLPYPGEPGGQPAPAGGAMADPGMEVGAGVSAPMAPDTLDGPVEGMPPVGISLEPAELAAMAIQAVGELAAMDRQMVQQMLAEAMMRFDAEQQASLSQVPAFIEAILGQMGGAPPETLDGPVAPEPPPEAMGGGMPMGMGDEELPPGAMLA